MDYQSLHAKTVVELRKLAKDEGVRVPAGTNKETLIQLLLESEAAPKPKAAEPAAKAEKAVEPAKQSAKVEKAVKPAKQGAKAEKVAEPAKSAGAERTAKPAEAPKTEPAAKPEARRGRPPKREEAGPKKAEPVKAQRAEAIKPVEAQKADGRAEEAKPAEAPKADRKAEVSKPAERRPEAPAAKREAPAQEAAQAQSPAGEGRVAMRNRAAAPYRMNPRPAADDRQRQSGGRGFQNWNNRQPQGDNRGQRYGQNNPSNGGNAARPMNNRYNNQNQPGDARPANDARQSGEARPSVQSWEGRDAQRRTPAPQAAQSVQPAPVAPAAPAPAPEAERPRFEPYTGGEYKAVNPAVPEMLAAGECGDGAGVLELQSDGYGFLRAENCLPGPNDVYISIAQIRRFNLRSGDHVVGKTRAQREGDRYSAMMYITEVNGESPEKAAERPRFEDLVPIYPNERFRLEPPAGGGDLSLRLIDMLAPIGKGQRGMIVSQPKAGKTTLLKKVANAITAQYPDVHLIVLLIDERPEEVTDMQRSIKGEVVYSTFDEAPENHIRVSEMVLGRAQRLVEMGKDVVVLLDSITRLARAYNLTITPTGRSLSGGLDPGALFKPKRFFGAARNIENGGSLTVIATALVETGSRMDDIIFEEFKGTGNMELHLDRKLSDRRVFPAIDLLKSGTRREELLLTHDELNGEYQVRRMLTGRQQEMYEQLIDLMSKTPTNEVFFSRLKGWLAVYEKEGYSLGR